MRLLRKLSTLRSRRGKDSKRKKKEREAAKSAPQNMMLQKFYRSNRMQSGDEENLDDTLSLMTEAKNDELLIDFPPEMGRKDQERLKSRVSPPRGSPRRSIVFQDLGQEDSSSFHQRSVCSFGSLGSVPEGVEMAFPVLSVAEDNTISVRSVPCCVRLQI